MATLICSDCRYLFESTDASPSPPQCPICGGTFQNGDDTTRGGPRVASTVLESRAVVRSTIGRYVVESQLGRGGFGSVFLARDPELDRLVAIKVPRWDTGTSAEALERFAREGRSAAQLHHPGIVPVYNVEHDGKTPFIVSEYVEGEPLSERVACTVRAGLRQYDGLRVERIERTRGGGPAGFDDGVSTGGAQSVDDIRRWSVGNDGKRTLQRHDRLNAGYRTRIERPSCRIDVNFELGRPDRSRRIVVYMEMR